MATLTAPAPGDRQGAEHQRSGPVGQQPDAGRSVVGCRSGSGPSRGGLIGARFGELIGQLVGESLEELVGQLVDELVELGVGEAALVVVDGGPLRVLAGMGGEAGGDGVPRELVERSGRWRTHGRPTLPTVVPARPRAGRLRRRWPCGPARGP